MAATAALSAATVGDLVSHSGGQILAFSTGLAALIPDVLRLGPRANLIPEPVLKGFIVGPALTIIIGQVPKLCCVDSGEGTSCRRPAVAQLRRHRHVAVGAAGGLVASAISPASRIRRSIRGGSGLPLQG